MIKKIIKRDGSTENFDPKKIEDAIKRAFKSLNYHYTDDLITNVVNDIDIWENITVEEIQDQVIEVLRDYDYYDVSDAYNEYRIEHASIRKSIEKDIEYMTGYISNGENAATSSNSDGNANITSKNISNLDSEVPKTRNRLIQRAWLKLALKECFPDEPNLSKQYEKDIANHIIYIHDEASAPTVKNYCEAVSLYPLILNGTSTMDGTGVKAPQHLSSFAGQICNLLFLLSSQCKGACAFGEFFNYFDYFAAKDFGENYDEKSEMYADTSIIPNRKTIGQKIDQTFQQIVHYWNQPAGNRGSQSPFSNISYYDANYWKALFEDFYFPDGTQPSWKRVNWLQKRFMNWFNEERSKTMLTFPVETVAMLTDGKDIIDKEWKNFTAEMWAKGHSFFVYLSDNPDSLASCCRLRNKITENVFSFTNGLTGVQTGSCNVITLNLNRITQDFCNTNHIQYSDKENFYNSFKQYLGNIVKNVHKYHVAFKHNLYMFEKAGQLKASTAGYISMKKLYSTVGLNGINEAAMYLGIKISDNEAYKEFCQIITSTISSLNKEESTPEVMFNQEFVPAESLGSKNFNWDKADGYWVPKDGRVLYNSYFYDAHDDTSPLEKLKMHGREFTSSLDGGVGCHINLNDYLSKEQYLKLLDYAIKVGCSYFTFNIPNTQCNACGYISKHRLTECPKCGSHKLTWWTRVIGFLRPTKNFDSFRQIEEKQRTYSKNIE